MNSFSEEIIEVDGIEYKLFLNRAGIALWEKTTKFSEFAELLNKKYNSEYIEDFKDDNLIVDDNFDPSKLLADFDSFDEDEEKLRNSILTFYCIALSRNHNMSLGATKEWFDKAENGTFNENGEPNNDAYGIEQLTQLMMQMIQNANTSTNQVNSLKNLKALKSTK
jgi:hypothetical protein